MNIHKIWQHLFSFRSIARSGRTTSIILVAVVAIAVFTPQAVLAVSIAYSDPAGGWDYAYTGDAAAGGTSDATNPPAAYDALDGTWDRTSGGDSWQGDGIGGTLEASVNPPGGISALTDGLTGYARIQDTGDPRDHGFPDGAPNPSNVGSDRRIYLGHGLAQDGVLETATFLNDGVTLSFRARLATEATGILDGQYPETAAGGENPAVAAGTAWQASGNGGLVHDGGKGDFSIRQNTGDSIISFSLGLDSDVRSDGVAFGTTGLNFNSLNGTSPSGTVDPYQNEGMVNTLAVSNVTDWHEFWITIRASIAANGEDGTHRVAIYKDGSLTPDVFFVTAGNGNDYNNINYIGMGSGATPQQNAYDVDFFAYKIGFHPAPEPGSVLLLALGSLGLFAIRRRETRR